ncbi:MAG: hypothetical protein LUE86_00460 [Clostridiales bacterium]|nr:hypothetical protein [Clostridiales bacterium]
MRSREIQVLAFWFVSGWLLAAVAANRMFASGLVSYPVLYRACMDGGETEAAGRICRIVLVRLLQMTVLFAVCHGRGRMAGVRAIAAFVGASAAFSLVLLVWIHGMAGLFCFLGSGRLHEPGDRALLAVMVLHGGYQYPIRGWKLACVVAGLFLAGVFLETKHL